MRMTCVVLFTTGALMAADGPIKNAPAKGDLDKLQGTWLTISLVNDGRTLVDKKSPPKEGSTTKLVYNGNKWMIKVGDKIVASGVFKIDSAKTAALTIHNVTGLCFGLNNGDLAYIHASFHVSTPTALTITRS